MAMRCEPVVSIQLKFAANAIEGHLSWGVLIERDQALVPGPLGWLLDPGIPFEVLLASAQRDGRGAVERIAVDRAEIRGIRDGEENAFAVITLAHPAQHPVNQGTRFDSAALAAHLTSAPDVWTALEQVGAVPAGVRDYPVHDVLGAVVRWEEIKRRDILRYRLAGSIDEAAIRWCCLMRLCTDCIECPGRWW